MQKSITPLLALPLIATSANAGVLLGGFDGNNAFNAPRQDASAAGSISVAIGIANADSLNNVPFQTTTTTWGTQDFDPDPVNSPERSVAVGEIYTVTMVVLNIGADDILLDSLHWRSKRDTNDSDTTATITYASGTLADADGASADVVLPSGIGNVDFALSSILTDRTLSPGETATFNWATDSGTRWVRIDNFAISGDIIIPEPTSFALLSLGGLLMAKRRRR